MSSRPPRCGLLHLGFDVFAFPATGHASIVPPKLHAGCYGFTMAFPKSILLIGGAGWLLCAQTMQRLSYPPAPRTDQIDDHHGIKIADPYRTLENADAPATLKWVKQENELTFEWLAKAPGREKIRTQLSGLWNFEKFPELYKAGGHYFYLHNSGL